MKIEPKKEWYMYVCTCVCVCITDSLCCIAETGLTLAINYPPIKFNKEIEGNLVKPNALLVNRDLSFLV